MERVTRPTWWDYPAGCPAGHPWGPGRVIVGWMPCDCPGALRHPGRGHLWVRCGTKDCTATWYRPRHGWLGDVAARWAARLTGMHTLVADHPLVTHKLTALRDARTETPVFRRLADELVTLLAYEATRHIRVEPVSVDTPLETAPGVRLARPVPLVIPVLRAGIGMLDGMARLLPQADVGFVGLIRDEQTLAASTYAERLPANLSGRDVFVLDPMLATGGTLQTVVEMLVTRGAATITAVCLLAAPEGVDRLAAAFPADEPPVRVVTGALDRQLNDKGYILPGLGDAGDRLFGQI
jgi:uracil phosphoribosyltransferase